MVEDSALKYAEDFARLSEELHREHHEQPALELIVARAVETIDVCDRCGISLREPDGTIVTVAGTDEIVTAVDELQIRYQEGPCYNALWSLDTYLVVDIDAETRWPRWTAEAKRYGIGSVLSLRLEGGDGQALAALNLYADRAGVYDATDLGVASIFARHASSALAGIQHDDNVRAALRSRQVIGVAQGMLMQRFGLSLDQSFEMMRRYSQAHNVKLRQLAENLVQAGGITQAAEDDADSALTRSFGLEPTP